AQGETLASLRVVQADALRWHGARNQEARHLVDAVLGAVPEMSALWYRAANTAAVLMAHGTDIDALIGLLSRLLADAVEPAAVAPYLRVLLTATDFLLISALESELCSRALARIDELAPSLTADDAALGAYISYVRGLALVDPEDPVQLVEVTTSSR